jgi:hypothetical protein
MTGRQQKNPPQAVGLKPLRSVLMKGRLNEAVREPATGDGAEAVREPANAGAADAIADDDDDDA